MPMKSWRAFWALCALLAISIFGLWASARPDRNQHGQHEHYQAHQNTKDENSPTVGKSALVTISKFVEGHDAAISAMSSVVSALAALAVAGFTFTLWKATRGLKDSTDKLWDAGERQIEHLTASSERQLRAYVSGRPVFIFSFETTKSIRITFDILNIGQTPARNVKHRGGVFIVQKTPSKEFQLHELNDSLSAPLVLFPNLPFTGTISSKIPPSVSEIDKIIDGSAIIYAYGEISYEDIFGTARITRFCSRVVTDSETLKKLCTNYAPADLKVSFEVAPFGNSAT